MNSLTSQQMISIWALHWLNRYWLLWSLNHLLDSWPTPILLSAWRITITEAFKCSGRSIPFHGLDSASSTNHTIVTRWLFYKQQCIRILDIVAAQQESLTAQYRYTQREHLFPCKTLGTEKCWISCCSTIYKTIITYSHKYRITCCEACRGRWKCWKICER